MLWGYKWPLPHIYGSPLTMYYISFMCRSKVNTILWLSHCIQLWLLYWNINIIILWIGFIFKKENMDRIINGEGTWHFYEIIIYTRIKLFPAYTYISQRSLPRGWWWCVVPMLWTRSRWGRGPLLGLSVRLHPMLHGDHPLLRVHGLGGLPGWLLSGDRSWWRGRGRGVHLGGGGASGCGLGHGRDLKAILAMHGPLQGKRLVWSCRVEVNGQLQMKNWWWFVSYYKSLSFTHDNFLPQTNIHIFPSFCVLWQWTIAGFSSKCQNTGK